MKKGGPLRPGVEDIAVPFVQLAVTQVGVALGDGDVLVARQFLGQLEVARCVQHCGDKIMAEGVGGDGSDGLFSQEFAHALGDDVAPGGGGDGLDLFTGALVMAGEDGREERCRPLAPSSLARATR